MLTIESKSVETPQTETTIFNFLSDLNNLEKLMPQDRVENWRSTETTCRFGIKNLSTIGMKIKETQAPNKIVLESDGKNPFTFSLTIHIQENDSKTKTYFVFDGDVNMFMSTMVKKPLSNFFDQLADNLPTAI